MSSPTGARVAELEGAVVEALEGYCDSVLIFSELGEVLYATLQVKDGELGGLVAAAGDKDGGFTAGLNVGGRRFEVLQHHAPVVYGRAIGGDAMQSDGIALHQLATDSIGEVFTVVTYRMPQVSARVVPMLRKFCEERLAALLGAA